MASCTQSSPGQHLGRLSMAPRAGAWLPEDRLAAEVSTMPGRCGARKRLRMETVVAQKSRQDGGKQSPKAKSAAATVAGAAGCVGKVGCRFFKQPPCPLARAGGPVEVDLADPTALVGKPCFDGSWK